MERVYEMSVGYKIFYGLVAAAIAGFGLYLLSTVPTSPYAKNGIIVAMVLLTISLFFTLYIIKRRVIVSDDAITVNGTFRTQHVYTRDVKGVRSNGKAIFIYRTDGGKMTINDYNAIGESDELKEWLKSNLQDLDTEEYEKEKSVILQDSDLGFTQEEREAKLKKASVLALVYSSVVFVLMLISIFSSKSNPVLSITVLVFPLIGIVLMALSRGLIRLTTKKKSAYPSIFLGLFFACVALIIRTFIDTKILDFSKMWTPVIVCGTILLGIFSLIILKQANPTIKGQIVPVLLISTVLSFGIVQEINKEFDGSKPQVFAATVTDQYIKRGKSTTYHIVITGWQHHQEPDDINVSSDFYNHISVGSNVNINLKPGKLHIPWYYISQ